jgi:hypothetical protein
MFWTSYKLERCGRVQLSSSRNRHCSPSRDISMTSFNQRSATSSCPLFLLNKYYAIVMYMTSSQIIYLSLNGTHANRPFVVLTLFRLARPRLVGRAHPLPRSEPREPPSAGPSDMPTPSFLRSRESPRWALRSSFFLPVFPSARMHETQLRRPSSSRALCVLLLLLQLAWWRHHHVTYALLPISFRKTNIWIQ